MIEIYNSSLYYLDPGTGSYLVQVVLAAGITLGIYFKSFKNMIFGFISKLKDKKNTS